MVDYFLKSSLHTKMHCTKLVSIGPVVLEKTIFNFVKVILLLHYNLLLKKGVAFNLNKRESYSPKMLFAKFDRN